MAGTPLRTLVRALLPTLLALACVSESSGAPASSTPQAPWREAVRKLAQEHFKNPAWGYSHCIRDYELANQLASTDHVKLDDDVLFAASYLHDMAAFPPWEKSGVDHADEAATVVETVLSGTGFPMSKLDAVRGAIRTHMFARDPVGPEARYLHDADALDWLGAIGVARIIGLVDAAGGKPTGPEVIPMLESNLKAVPARVMTPAGKALVAPRVAELQQFLSDLRRETGDLRTL